MQFILNSSPFCCLRSMPYIAKYPMVRPMWKGRIDTVRTRCHSSFPKYSMTLDSSNSDSQHKKNIKKSSICTPNTLICLAQKSELQEHGSKEILSSLFRIETK